MPENQRERVTAAFRRHFGRAPAFVVRSPGRVNLLGAHVDYSEGLVLPAAIDRAVWLAAGPAGDGCLTALALDLEGQCRLDPSELPPPVARRTAGTVGWADYPAAAAWALREAGRPVPGMAAVFGGDLPRGAGVSSSAAVEVAFLLAWQALAEEGSSELSAPSRLELARLARRAENGYLGVGSGIMDPFACLHGTVDHALLLDCRSLAFERLPLPPETVILVADSGVERRLAGSGFDDRRRQCEEAVNLLRPHLPGIRTLRDLSPAAFELHAHRLPQPLRRRAQHAVEEIARVEAGAVALGRGDLESFGALLRRSQASSRDLYEVSLPELDVLCAAAWATPGCWGARLAGGGFGGCVTVLARKEAEDSVRAAMTVAFTTEFGRTPPIFSAAVADGAGIV